MFKVYLGLIMSLGKGSLGMQLSIGDHLAGMHKALRWLHSTAKGNEANVDSSTGTGVMGETFLPTASVLLFISQDYHQHPWSICSNAHHGNGLASVTLVASWVHLTVPSFQNGSPSALALSPPHASSDEILTAHTLVALKTNSQKLFQSL